VGQVSVRRCSPRTDAEILDVTGRKRLQQVGAASLELKLEFVSCWDFHNALGRAHVRPVRASPGGRAICRLPDP